MKNKKSLIAIAIVAFVLIVLAITCPGKKEHADEISSAFSEAIQQQPDDGFGKAFNTLLASHLINSLLDSNLKVHNYVFFSTGELTIEDRTQTVSVGFLNNVILFGKDDLKQSASKK